VCAGWFARVCSLSCLLAVTAADSNSPALTALHYAGTAGGMLHAACCIAVAASAVDRSAAAKPIAFPPDPISTTQPPAAPAHYHRRWIANDRSPRAGVETQSRHAETVRAQPFGPVPAIRLPARTLSQIRQRQPLIPNVNHAHPAPNLPRASESLKPIWHKRVPRLASFMRFSKAIRAPVHEHVSSRAFAQPLAASSLSAHWSCFLSDPRSAGRQLLIFHTSYFPSPQFSFNPSRWS
jgi:hypothetical protein